MRESIGQDKKIIISHISAVSISFNLKIYTYNNKFKFNQSEFHF